MDFVDRVVAVSEFDAGGQADAAHHRRQDVAAHRVEDRVLQAGPGQGGVVHVVAALDRQGNAVAQGFKDAAGLRAQRHHHFLGGDRAEFAVHLPAAFDLGQAQGITDDELAAALLEQFGVATGQAAGVADGLGVEPVQAADYVLVQARFQGPQCSAIQYPVVELVVAQVGGGALGDVEGLLVVEGFEPAAVSDQLQHVGRAGQVQVFAHAAFDQRQHGASGGSQALGRGVAPVLQQPGAGLGQVAQAVAHVRLLVEAVAHQLGHFPGEGVGNHAGAFDQPGVAVAGAVARGLAVQQHYLAAAGLQVQGAADADDSGAQNEGLAMHVSVLMTGAAGRPAQGFSSGAGPGGLPGI